MDVWAAVVISSLTTFIVTVTLIVWLAVRVMRKTINKYQKDQDQAQKVINDITRLGRQVRDKRDTPWPKSENL